MGKPEYSPSYSYYCLKECCIMNLILLFALNLAQNGFLYCLIYFTGKEGKEAIPF